MLDDMLSLQGNTAVYLLYAHARIVGIKDVTADIVTTVLASVLCCAGS